MQLILSEMPAQANLSGADTNGIQKVHVNSCLCLDVRPKDQRVKTQTIRLEGVSVQGRDRHPGSAL